MGFLYILSKRNKSYSLAQIQGLLGGNPPFPVANNKNGQKARTHKKANMKFKTRRWMKCWNCTTRV